MAAPIGEVSDNVSRTNLSTADNLQNDDALSKSSQKEVDIFRDTYVRYLGYANEVGEAFRALVHVSLVRMSYGIATGYVCADAYHKGNEAAQQSWPAGASKQSKILHAVLDTLLWQGLASVIIPGFTINRICFLTNAVLQRTTSLPGPVRKWTTTAVGLGCIPIIIKPIDHSVDYGMNRTIRRWYRIDTKEQEIVHHERND